MLAVNEGCMPSVGSRAKPQPKSDMHFALKYNIFGGSNVNDFTENQSTNYRVV